MELVLTGAGVACRLGDDEVGLLRALRTGASPPFDRYPEAEEAGCACTIIGRYPGDLSDEALRLDRSEGRFAGRASRLALVAARRALAVSGLDPRTAAVVVGSGTGDVDAHRQIGEVLARSTARRVAPTMIPRIMASSVSANLAHLLRVTGPSLSVSAACAGGAWNLVVAAQIVASGMAPAALAGGAEVADLHFHAGFDAMRAYNRVDGPERPSRPYAADRKGFVFAEGAGVLVVESRRAAEARGAPILACLLGWGASSDGEGQMVSPSSNGAAAAMEAALAHANVLPEQVGYVNTHATGTPAGDGCEVRALRRVFGRPPPYASTKGLTGHTISGAGAIEAAFTAWMLRDGFLAPCSHADPVDPELADAPPLTEPLERRVAVAMSNSFGFGGTNVSLVLGSVTPAG
ncbi:MAG: beta-ketoacyl-[acyl-carrier-protein] synthase family protein [Myxococcales bacterium]|nr:beta-ketoacyl-[acyl-carrier-protein] synthase family protein [Myxococcales bacterium]